MAPADNSATGGIDPRQAEIEQLKADLKSVRAEMAKLVQDGGKFASEEAKRQKAKAADVAEDAAEKATEYRDMLEGKVREHPLAAIGIAVAAGMLFSSFSRR